MKRILVTGSGSYIGTSFENYISQWADQYVVDTVDMIDGSWREKSFVGYDTVFHVAGIAHIKETKQNAHLYYKVNRDLAIETAKKAKESGVSQFIFLSSMSIFGLTVGEITRATKPNPSSNYGISKLEAEKGIIELSDETFKVVILRPPMVYGKDCKGNYKLLEKFASCFPIFPNIQNKRSMILIDRLCQFVRSCVDNSAHGIFHPQDEEYVCTYEMVKKIGEMQNKHIRGIKIFNPIIKKLHINLFEKVFGDLIYDKQIDQIERA